VPADYTSKFGSNYNALKTALVSTYKFTMAFENSATDDYVTEKLFGVLVSGSVPRMFSMAREGRREEGEGRREEGGGREEGRGA
jgi:hypothetical protein